MLGNVFNITPLLRSVRCLKTSLYHLVDLPSPHFENVSLLSIHSFDIGCKHTLIIEDIIAGQTTALHHHLGLRERDGMPNRSPPPEIPPLFLAERSSNSTRAAKCKLPSCNNSIKNNHYRIAMTLAMSDPV